MKEAELVPWGWAAERKTNYWPNLFIKYRVTSTDFKGLWDRQQGKCAGCKGALAHPVMKGMEMGLRPEVDHKHIVGSHCELKDVRGLLCHRCNKFLGAVRDNQDILGNLLQYLKAHGDLNGEV